jgi:hypothetical protein
MEYQFAVWLFDTTAAARTHEVMGTSFKEVILIEMTEAFNF